MSHLMLKAAYAGDIAKVKAFLDSGVDVNYHSKDKQGTGRTALSEACLRGNLELVRLLIKRGANVNWLDQVGTTPLDWAANNSFVSVVVELLKAGADPNIHSPEINNTPLMTASKRGSMPIVKLLIATGANVNAANIRGQTALGFAQTHNHTDIVALLTGMGAVGTTPQPSPIPIPWPSIDESTKFFDHSSPEKVLRGFILAMNRWELKAHELSQTAKQTQVSALEPILEEMKQVFDTFCTPIDRKFGRYGSYQIPPEYQPTEFLIEINMVKPSRAELITHGGQGFIEKENLYVVLKKKGRWLIDSKKYRVPGSKLWDKAIL